MDNESSLKAVVPHPSTGASGTCALFPSNFNKGKTSPYLTGPGDEDSCGETFLAVNEAGMRCIFPYHER